MKTFQIQIQDGLSTRWVASEEELRACVKTLVESMARIHTSGPEPRVIVTVEKCVCEICAERKTSLAR